MGQTIYSLTVLKAIKGLKSNNKLEVIFHLMSDKIEKLR